MPNYLTATLAPAVAYSFGYFRLFAAYVGGPRYNEGENTLASNGQISKPPTCGIASTQPDLTISVGSLKD